MILVFIYFPFYLIFYAYILIFIQYFLRVRKI